MAEKSITVKPRNGHHAATLAELFGVPQGESEMVIPFTAIDQAIESHLRNLQSVADSGTPESRDCLPERIDREIVLTDADQLNVLQAKADFLNSTNKQQGYKQMRSSHEAIRTTIVLRNLPLDIQGHTIIYGLSHPQAESIGCDGIPRSCNTLIHGSHALSPEDEYLRERQITCDRIVRYFIPGLDDAQWSLINQPLRWPMTIQEWRLLCLDKVMRQS